MDYGVTLYFNDADIATTNILGVNGMVDVTKAYGSSAYSATGFSGTTTFTATPASGCYFTQWVYRLGSDPDTVLTSTDNPFIYTSGVDIEIRALGESEAGPPPSTDAWKLYYAGSFSSIKNYTSAAFELVENEMIVYTVTFAYGGLAIFSTTGSVGTRGFLCDEYPSSVFDYDEGVPETSLTEQDGVYGDFEFSWLVSPNTTYYVCVRGSFGDETGSVQLHIDPPTGGGAWVVTSSSIADPLTGDVSRTMILTNYDLRRVSVRFANSGRAYFYAISTGDLVGYLSSGSNTAADTTNGRPSSYDAYNDNGGGAYGRGFKIGYDVTAGVTYYVWVRCKEATASTTATFRIIAPGNFEWTSPKEQGEEFNLTAAEWNRLMYRIDFVRRNETTSGYTPAEVVKGDAFTALLYNNACKAIKKVEGYGTQLPTAVAGEPVTAYAMNKIVDELNAIPKE